MTTTNFNAIEEIEKQIIPDRFKLGASQRGRNQGLEVSKEIIEQARQVLIEDLCQCLERITEKNYCKSKNPKAWAICYNCKIINSVLGEKK